MGEVRWSQIFEGMGALP